MVIMRVGRPKTEESRKKSEKIFVNLTKSQKKKLLIHAEKEDESLSRICIKALKEAGYI